MGWLANALAPLASTERRSAWDDLDEVGTATASGRRVNREQAMRLSTVWACVRLLTNAIATLPTEITVSIGPRRFPEYTKPSWLTAPDPANPTMSATEHFAQVAASLLLDGNFFTYVPGTIFDPRVLIVLDPRRVDIKVAPNRTPLYEIRDDMGRVSATVGPLQMLHGAWLTMPGASRGLNPIEAAREAIGLGVTSEEFASRFFSQGAALSFGVEVPGGMTDEQKADLRSSLKATYSGVRKSHNIGVLTGGAKFATGLGVSNEDAQFLELRKFQVEDIARWFGVPPHMVGSQDPGASSYSSVEVRSLEFREYAVLPLVRRIEVAYQRLVELPDRLRGTNATASFRFNLDALARADLKTRFEAYGLGINAGVLKPDEARALEDLGPVAGGNVTYMQSQMVPLGTSPTSRPASQPDQPEAA